jgi:integrase
MPEPFYKPSRDTWYVEIDRKQYSLGRHPETAPPPKKNKNGEWKPPPQIQSAFHQLMAAPPEPRPTLRAGSVVELIDKFLAWCQENRKPETYEWYRWRLQLFCDYLKKNRIPQALVSELKPFHLDEFLSCWPGWSSGMKHGACRVVQRAMLWAEKKGYIDRSPVAHYEKPRPGKRNVVISPEEFEKILSVAGSQNFRDLLEVTWETAARPQESLAVEARHVDLVNARWFFPPDESKGEQWPRVVYLTSRALEITRRLMEAHPSGPLFRNADGRPWTPFAVNCAFIRIQERLGRDRLGDLNVSLQPLPRFDRRRYQDRTALMEAREEHKANLRERTRSLRRLALKHGRKYCLYHLRHSWLDRALKSGVDALTCAIIMGHRDPSTLAKVYQHLSQSPSYLQEQVKKVKS